MAKTESDATPAASQKNPAEEIELALPRSLAQALVDYLQQRPFVEVHQLISALVALKPVEKKD